MSHNERRCWLSRVHSCPWRPRSRGRLSTATAERPATSSTTRRASASFGVHRSGRAGSIDDVSDFDELRDELARLEAETRRLRGELLRARENAERCNERRAYTRCEPPRPMTMLKPAVVRATTLDRPTCRACTALLARCDEADVDATIEALKPILICTTEMGMCWRCRNVIALYAIACPK